MGNVHMEASQINYRGGEKKMSVEEAIKNAENTGLAHTADIAPEFSATSAYNAGDIVYYNGSLYEFTANHAAGAWSADDTQAVTVGGKITSLSGDVTDLNDVKANQITIAPTFSAENAYDPGDLVYYNGLTYRCVNSHEGEWDADDFAATTIDGELAELRSGLTNLLKYKVCNDGASDTTNHLYSTGVPVGQYVCVGGCTPNNPNYCVEISNIEISSGGDIRYRLYDVATNQVVSDNSAYTVYLVFIDTSMLSELVITP